MVDISKDIEKVLPKSFEWYREQIAGHHPSVIKNGEHQIGLIKERGSKTLLKPVQEGIRGVCEVSFYNKMRGQIDGDKNRDDILAQCVHFLPKYYGLTDIKIANKDIECLVLEDLTHRYKNPCIIDIKMGKVTFDPDATKAKRLSEVVKYPEQQTLGFRLLGYRMRIGVNGKEVLKTRDKQWGRTRTSTNIVEALGEFLFGRTNEELEVVEQVLAQLYEIQKWFQTQQVYHFYASSILVAYEGCREQLAQVTVKLIDFSHVFPSNETVDENYLFGLNNLVAVVEQCKQLSHSC